MVLSVLVLLTGTVLLVQMQLLGNSYGYALLPSESFGSEPNCPGQISLEPSNAFSSKFAKDFLDALGKAANRDRVVMLSSASINSVDFALNLAQNLKQFERDKNLVFICEDQSSFDALQKSSLGHQVVLADQIEDSLHHMLPGYLSLAWNLELNIFWLSTNLFFLNDPITEISKYERIDLAVWRFDDAVYQDFIFFSQSCLSKSLLIDWKKNLELFPNKSAFRSIVTSLLTTNKNPYLVVLDHNQGYPIEDMSSSFKPIPSISLFFSFQAPDRRLLGVLQRHCRKMWLIPCYMDVESRLLASLDLNQFSMCSDELVGDSNLLAHRFAPLLRCPVLIDSRHNDHNPDICSQSEEWIGFNESIFTVSPQFRKSSISILSNIRTNDNFALLTSFSFPYLDLVFNMLENLKYFGLHKHILLICEDRKSFDLLKETGFAQQIVLSDRGSKIYKHEAGNFSDNVYWSITITRPWYMTFGWEAGVKTIWIDPDIFFTRNILETFRSFGNDLDLGLIIQGDSNKHICSGIVFVAPSCRNSEFLKQWQRILSSRGDGFDQGALASAVHKLGGHRSSSSWKVKFISRTLGCSGSTYWDTQDCDLEQMIFAHANWIIGHDLKVKRLYCSKMWLLPCHLNAVGESVVQSSQEFNCQGSNSAPRRVLDINAASTRSECPLGSAQTFMPQTSPIQEKNLSSAGSLDCPPNWVSSKSLFISSRFRSQAIQTIERNKDSHNTVLLTSFSYGYIDLVFNLLANLKHFGIDKNLVLICEDSRSFQKLNETEYKNQLVLSDRGVHYQQTLASNFSDSVYWNLTVTRPWYMSFGWEAGANTIWIDPDIFFVKNIAKQFRSLGKDLDAGFILEWFPRNSKVGLPRDVHRHVCSGIVYLAHSCKNRDFLRKWQELLNKRGDGYDQGALAAAIHRTKKNQEMKNWKHEFIDVDQGCSGASVWKNQTCDFRKMIFIHANWMLGRETKIRRLRCNDMWLLPCSLDSKGDHVLHFDTWDRSDCLTEDMIHEAPKAIKDVSWVSKKHACPLQPRIVPHQTLKKLSNTSWVSHEGLFSISDRFRLDATSRLKSLATHDGFVLMTSFSYPYLDMVFNTLYNLKFFNLDSHILLLCEDKQSFDILNANGYGNQTVLSDRGQVTKNNDLGGFGSQQYWSLTMTRPWYMTFGWEAQVNLVWIDPDLFFVKNILEEFRNFGPELDTGLIVERYTSDEICSGIVFLASNFRTRALLIHWQKAMKARGDGFDQLALRDAVELLGGFNPVPRGLQVRFIDIYKGCSGWTFWKAKDCKYDEMIFVHANWIKGRFAKTRRLHCSNMWLLPCKLDKNGRDVLPVDLKDRSYCFAGRVPTPASVFPVFNATAVSVCPLSSGTLS